MKTQRVITILALFLSGFFAPTLRELAPLTSLARAASPAARKVEVINVGITEYQNIEDSYDRYERLFQQLAESANANTPVTFKFAIGNYGEVLDWYNKGWIDIAILSATPVADLLNKAGTVELDKIEKAYIGDVSISRTPAKSNQGVRDLFPRLERPDPFKYRTGCIVLKSDDLKTIDDIKRLWQQDQVKFLFVRPYSMSGYILPKEALRQHGIYPRPDQMEFTYEHAKSLAKIRKSTTDQTAAKKRLVAFVLDTTQEQGDPPQIFERIPIKELDDYRIPREIVLANYHQENDVGVDKRYPNKFEKYKAIMIDLFNNWKGRKASGPPRRSGSSDVAPVTIEWRQRSDKWRADYDLGRVAMKNIQLPRELFYRSSLDALLEDLAKKIDRRDAQAKRPRTVGKSPRQAEYTDIEGLPRLALVLSGGGAKCAYQAGAIVEIEKKLQEINSRREGEGKRPLDVGLVVGTSGGAINALLVAAGVTRDPKAAEELAAMWASFKQQQFFQPSRRVNVAFGLCFGLLQALTITVAVLLFGRQSMNWPKTVFVLAVMAAFEIAAFLYFRLPWRAIGWVLGIEALFVFSIIGIVLIVGLVITRIQNWWKERKATHATEKSEAQPADGETAIRPEQEPSGDHWRWLTIVLMLAFSIIEWIIAKAPGLDRLVSDLTTNHWADHTWMLVTLVCNLSFPYPLAIAILMTVIGGVIWESFDWNRKRETLVWWMTVILIAVSAGVLLEAFFRENAPSKAVGIEEAFAQKIPVLLQRTVKPDFKPSPPRKDETALQSISRQLMDENAPGLERDLVITTSRLPMNLPERDDLINNSPEELDKHEKLTKQAELVNSLPDDLYFYFRKNTDEKLKPPLDKKFVPFKYNPEKLLDVVIGSSTIYPIFPSRELKDVALGSEERSFELVDKISIVDGGFIHNIPIEAAGLWKASHVIVIEASALRPQNQPRHFWDNAMMAFGYLFSQAQRSDKLARGNAETFELRPTSQCEKENTLPSCAGSQNLPEPDMDTFDFSDYLLRNAFRMGAADAIGCVPCINCPAAQVCAAGYDPENSRPLFIRVPGPPLFRSPALSSSLATAADRKNRRPRGSAKVHVSGSRLTAETGARGSARPPVMSPLSFLKAKLLLLQTWFMEIAAIDGV